MSLINRQYRVVFLLGAMRSGTTYFRNVIAANTNIRSLGSELNRFWTEIGGAPSGSVPVCRAMSAQDATGALCDSVRQHFDTEYRARNSPRELAYRCYRKVRFGNETILKYGRPFYLLNKSTHLLNKVAFLDRIVPNARYVFIVRDIYSQVFSLFRHLRTRAMRQAFSISYPGKGACWSFKSGNGKESSAEWSFSDLPAYWLDMNQLAMKELDRLTGGRVLYVSYETLVRSPERVLENVATLLETAHMNANINRKLINNYSDAPLESWKSGLSNEQKETIASAIQVRDADHEFVRSHVVGGNE